MYSSSQAAPAAGGNARPSQGPRSYSSAAHCEWVEPPSGAELRAAAPREPGGEGRPRRERPRELWSGSPSQRGVGVTLRGWCRGSARQVVVGAGARIAERRHHERPRPLPAATGRTFGRIPGGREGAEAIIGALRSRSPRPSEVGCDLRPRLGGPPPGSASARAARRGPFGGRGTQLGEGAEPGWARRPGVTTRSRVPRMWHVAPSGWAPDSRGVRKARTALRVLRRADAGVDRAGQPAGSRPWSRGEPLSVAAA